MIAPETSRAVAPAAEAPTGYFNLTNGYDPQGQTFESLTTGSAVPLRSFNDNRFFFEQVETVSAGLGPTYNAQSCRECHQNVVTGGGSQITVLRAMGAWRRMFFPSPSGAVLQARAIDPEALEQLGDQDNVRALRMSISTLGDGYVEAIANDTLLRIRDAQPPQVRGFAAIVPVLESGGQMRVGRFGWKSQHASLESFAADAYLNEMGITSPLLPNENEIASGQPGRFDQVPDPEDDGREVQAVADFIRSTMAPPRGPISADTITGEEVFERIGCGVCHVASIRTAEIGTTVNGGAMQIPAALASKIIHPYSDFLLHDVGTGDGIPIQPTEEYASTATQMRTAPLWGLRTRNRLMHDGLSYTFEEAILRHGGQARGARNAFRALTPDEQRQLMTFLRSL